MGTLKLESKADYSGYLLLVLLSVWILLQRMVMSADPTIGFIDPNIWLLILLGIVWFTAIGSSWGADRHIVRRSSIDQKKEKVVAVAQKELGVREAKGNTGKRVDEYNAYVGMTKVAWCASFVSWCFGQAGYSQPRTAWSPALFPSGRVVKDPQAGMVLGIYFPELKRIAHCGVIEQVKNDWVISIEGNSNVNGSREGDGVYRRIRHKRSIYRFAEW